MNLSTKLFWEIKRRLWFQLLVMRELFFVVYKFKLNTILDF